MKKIHVFGLIAGAVMAVQSQAQVVQVQANGMADELVCPAKKAAVQPRPAQPAANAEPLEPPERDELENLLAAQEKPQPKLSLGRFSNVSANRPLVVGFWGDSHLAAHFFTDELIKLSGTARPQVQPTLIPPTMGRPGVRLPIRKSCQGAGWSYRHAYLAKDSSAAFAPSLAQLKSEVADSYLWIDFRLQAGAPALRRLDIQFAPNPDKSRTVVGLSVDDGEEQLVELDPEDRGSLSVQPDQALSTIRLRLVEGSLSLEGFVPYYLEKTALFLDTFGFPGATARGWSTVDSAYFKERLGNVNYDLVVLEYGTNEGNNRKFDAESYAADLRRALANMRRAMPAAQCVLMGPTDRGVMVPRPAKKKGKRVKTPLPDLLKFSKIHREIGEVQRSVGQEFDCQFWSWQEAMGGPGGVYRWLYQTPRLMAKDLIHLTIPGYQSSARQFAEPLQIQDWAVRDVR